MDPRTTRRPWPRPRLDDRTLYVTMWSLCVVGVAVAIDTTQLLCIAAVSIISSTLLVGQISL